MIGSASMGQAQSWLANPDSFVRSPRLLVPGTTLRITSDSAYLVTPERYRFYQKLHHYLADSTTAGACSRLITSYEESLQETQRAYNYVLRQYQAADSLSARSMHRTQLTLGQLSRTLDQTQYSLEQTTQTLNEVEEQLKREQHRSFFRRIAYGASGVGAGMLLMGLLMQ